MKRVWLTVDSDDFRHLPKHQGHPYRSKEPYKHRVSPQFQQAMVSFEKWLNSNQYPLTIFVIADQLEDALFSDWLEKLLKNHPQITIGCHGLTHRSWSAWEKDVSGFTSDLKQATIRISNFAGDSWRPWFRAPAGYIAPWMAPILVNLGYTVDSSINPSWLLRKKSGTVKSWSNVRKALNESGLIVKEWYCKWGIPTCGPALSLPFLGTFSRFQWRQLGEPVSMESSQVTVYWHILDHSRKKGCWTPPFRFDKVFDKTIGSSQESKQPVLRGML